MGKERWPPCSSSCRLFQQVPLSLWEVAQELGREGTGQRPAKDLSMYRRRMGSILEGVPVIDYTTEGSRASRLQRWEKLQTDHEGLAPARLQQALRYKPSSLVLSMDVLNTSLHRWP